MAMGIGMVLIAIGTATVLLAEDDTRLSAQRRDASDSLLVAETGVAIALAQLNKPNNSVLMTRNLDQVNPDTNKNYLGPDGIPNTNDETSTAVNNWSTYSHTTQPCYPTLSWEAANITLTGTVGTDGKYAVRAYRYDPTRSVGTLLVEGEQDGQKSYVSVQVDVEPSLDNFPGILTTKNILLRGRQLSGTYSNVYYDPAQSANPSLTNYAKPTATNRGQYLDALWSWTQDGVGTDSVAGNIVACRLLPTLTITPQGTDLGDISNSRNLTSTAGKITHYQAKKITLKNDEKLLADTTQGPIYLYVTDAFELKNNSQILNIRTDGLPPRVGDLRIFVDVPASLFNTSCIQDASIFIPDTDLHILTTGKGCPSGNNTNVEGVVWVENVVSSINSPTGRIVPAEDDHGVTTNGVTSGIAIPRDLSSLSDLHDKVKWPTYYRVKAVKNWQRVRV